MGKRIEFDLDGSIKVLEGAIMMEKAVGSTFGPMGRTVLFKDQAGKIRFTKDGREVAAMISLRDPLENMGAQLLKSVAEKTAKDVGDGTTTATLLTRALFQYALKYIAAGADSDKLKRGMRLAIDRVKKDLDIVAEPLRGSENLQQVALIAGNGDTELADHLVQAVGDSGSDFVIHIEKSTGSISRVIKSNGLKYDKGFASRHFITDQKGQVVEFDTPSLLVTDLKIQSITEIIHLLEESASKNKPLVFICDSIDETVLGGLVRNIQEGKLKLASTSVPGFGQQRSEILEDIAVATGAKFISKDEYSDLKAVKFTDLGECQRIFIEEHTTFIVEGNKKDELFDPYLNRMRSILKNTDSDHEKESYRSRISALTHGFVKLELAALTETELAERMERAADAIHAMRAAMQEGTVPGGGYSFYKSRDVLKRLAPIEQEVAMGIKIVIDALAVPISRLLINAGKDPKVILGKLDALDTVGYNVMNEEFEDLRIAGIIDPVKTLKTALENAYSLSALMLSSFCFITESSEN
ncbi:chaperonin GroEL [Algoriphagus persicinus]|uniref:chaperonin GroEL n=1 Tax=Algoriphagus persicinus TaxID=3108754 RepID=UPI002B39B471|nr:chaperonin GroEL [Algoriphagus sp. E1-3-M2]MEB2785234.1 chaperonin GroEL [Algoriphagus sp. E1-3-M2]